MIDSVLEVVYLLDFYSCLLNARHPPLPVHPEPLSTSLSSVIVNPADPAGGTALNCSTIALMLVRNWICCFCLFVCFSARSFKTRWTFLIYCDTKYLEFCFPPTSDVGWRSPVMSADDNGWTKPVFPSCVQVLGDQRMCTIVDVANKQNKARTLVEAIPFLSAGNKGRLASETRRWR